jgi:hypothetical protein
MPAVTSATVQEDKEFLQSIATAGSGSPAAPAATTSAPPPPSAPAPAPVRSERRTDPEVIDTPPGPAPARTVRPAPRVAAKPAAALPPIAAKTTKAKSVKRETAEASAQAAEARPRTPAGRLTTRKSAAPPHDSIQREVPAVAQAPAPAKVRTVPRSHVGEPGAPRYVEVRRAIPVGAGDRAGEVRKRGLFDPPPPGEGFFDKLFADDDGDDD